MKETVRKETITFRYVGKTERFAHYTVTRNIDDGIVCDICFNLLSNQYVLSKTIMALTPATLALVIAFLNDLNKEYIEESK